MQFVIPDEKELSHILGKAYSMFTLFNDYIDCYYNTEIKYGRRGIHGLFSMTHRQAGKTLCTLYINEGYFTVLLVFGKREQEVFEASEYHVARELQAIYDKTHIYPEGKWIWLDINDISHFADLKHFLSIKRMPDEKAMTMCGIKCNLCKAYAKNIKKNDQRAQLSAVWKKAYDVDIPAENICCDGCRCTKKGARRVDPDCPVRKCVIEKKLTQCGECQEFPCKTFGQRESFSCAEAKEHFGATFDAGKYNEYLLAYDNKNRINKYINCKNGGKSK